MFDINKLVMESLETLQEEEKPNMTDELKKLSPEQLDAAKQVTSKTKELSDKASDIIKTPKRKIEDVEDKGGFVGKGVRALQRAAEVNPKLAGAIAGLSAGAGALGIAKILRKKRQQ